MRGTQSKRSFLFEFPLALDHLRINIRIVEKTELKFVLEERGNQFIQHRLVQCAAPNKLNELRITIGIRQFDIDTGLYGKQSGVSFVLRHSVACRFVPEVQFCNGIII